MAVVLVSWQLLFVGATDFITSPWLFFLSHSLSLPLSKLGFCFCAPSAKLRQSLVLRYCSNALCTAASLRCGSRFSLEQKTNFPIYVQVQLNKRIADVRVFDCMPEWPTGLMKAFRECCWMQYFCRKQNHLHSFESQCC